MRAETMILAHDCDDPFWLFQVTDGTPDDDNCVQGHWLEINDAADPPVKYKKGEPDDNGMHRASIICVVRNSWASSGRDPKFKLSATERKKILVCEKTDVCKTNEKMQQMKIKNAALIEAATGIKKYTSLTQTYMTMHEHIDKNASPGVQVADTHYNGPYKLYMNKKSTEYQQEAILRGVEEEGLKGEALMQQLNMLKEDPKMILSDLPLWPAKLKIPLPSRARVLLWSREARRELFETEDGRMLGERAFYEDGLTRNANGTYLLYSERERGRKGAANNATDKRDAKKRKKIEIEKAPAAEFAGALGRMGLGFDCEGHSCL
jgi:hypothetical protein